MIRFSHDPDLFKEEESLTYEFLGVHEASAAHGRDLRCTGRDGLSDRLQFQPCRGKNGSRADAIAAANRCSASGRGPIAFSIGATSSRHPSH